MAKRPKNNQPPDKKGKVSAVQPPAESAGSESIAEETPSPAQSATSANILEQTSAPVTPPTNYPLLRSLLGDLGLPLLPRYTKSDLVPVLAAKPRTIQEWMRSGRLPSRRMPNNFRCLPSDLEEFLQNSRVNSDSDPVEGGDA